MAKKNKRLKPAAAAALPSSPSLSSPPPSAEAAAVAYDSAVFEDRNVVVGRTEELKAIREFLVGHIVGNTGGHLYVCGTPGTGKTACVQVVVEGVRKWLAADASNLGQRVKLISLRANTFNGSVKHSWDAIAKGLDIDSDSPLHIQNLMCSNASRLYVIVMDEIDLLSKDVLLSLFKLSQPKSSLVILGIANMIDVQTKLLKDLVEAPLELPFSPYDPKTLLAIVSKNVDLGRFAPDAMDKPLELCARKAAANSGDARMVIDVARRAMTLAGGDMVKSEHVMRALQVCLFLSLFPFKY